MTAATADPQDAPAPLTISGAALRRGDRELWAGLDLEVAPGELIAVLGPSGSGKTTLRAILGLEPLSAGSITALGAPVHHRGNRRIGYLPQARPLPRETAMRGRDLVTLGVDGHRRAVAAGDVVHLRPVDRSAAPAGRGARSTVTNPATECAT